MASASHIFFYVGSSWALLVPSWGPLGVSWGHLGALLGPLGAILGPSWPSWGHLGTLLGPSWGTLGPSWGHHGAILARPGFIWGHLGATFGQLGRIVSSRAVSKPFGSPFDVFSGPFRGRLGSVWVLSSAPSATSEHAVIILALLPTIPKTTPTLKHSIPHTLVGRGGDAKR